MILYWPSFTSEKNYFSTKDIVPKVLSLELFILKIEWGSESYTIHIFDDLLGVYIYNNVLTY